MGLSKTFTDLGCFMVVFSMVIYNGVNGATSDINIIQDKDKAIISSPTTKDVPATSQFQCVSYCYFQSTRCCVANFFPNKTCRMNEAIPCTYSTQSFPGSRVLEPALYAPYPNRCIECVLFKLTRYLFVEHLVTQETAKVQCEALSGKLVEIKSEEENEFLKQHFSARSGERYWLGGYKFGPGLNRTDYRWVSSPQQEMAFTDWYEIEPNKPTTDFCMIASPLKLYQWADNDCMNLRYYCCKFFD